MNQIIDSYNTTTTREKILMAGFQEMYQYGYQGMRIDAILKSTNLAKGALYHHFSNKVTLAYAIVDEILFEHSSEQFELNLAQFDDPIEGICSTLMGCSAELSEEEISLGCPVNNLVQEMSGLDEGFKTRLTNIYNCWTGLLAKKLEEGKNEGFVKEEVNVGATALFIVSALQGIAGMAKCMQSKALMREQQEILCQFIENLRK
ncbi:MAG: TetR/AcrR family transcriptional repressor of nem operon [Lentisphaeria bacterium]|jgi:TetR/AcrR family transcriptional repressor of nem operon